MPPSARRADKLPPPGQQFVDVRGGGEWLTVERVGTGSPRGRPGSRTRVMEAWIPGDRGYPFPG